MTGRISDREIDRTSGPRPGRIGPDARPDLRPDTRPAVTDRPWYENRPTRPGYENRPNNSIGSGNNIVNNPNVWNNQGNINLNNINPNIYARPGVATRPWYGQPWNSPTYPYHNGWHQGYWNYWPPGSYYPLAYAAGVTTGWLMSGPSYVYANPYYVTPPPTTTVVYDYSQPLPMTPPPTQTPTTVNVTVAGDPASADTATPTPPPEPDPQTKAAIDKFDAARAAFKQGDYPAALKQVDEAIKSLPGDPVLHEFRGLVLFAQGDYQSAAGTVYAVLAAGPGWDWDTLKSLYPNVNTYTDQLHKLEDYVQKNAQTADARFLLAYHYLTLGYADEARNELATVVQLQPKDELSAQLVKLLTPADQANAAVEVKS